MTKLLNNTQNNTKKINSNQTEEKQQRIESAIKEVLLAVGEDPNREGLINTPNRVGRMYLELFAGIGKAPKDEITITYKEDYEEIVLVRDIPFYSVCEHHLIPFFGHANVAYLPRNGLITGLSKLARVVETTARRPQLQERMTGQIADAICEKLDPVGVAIVLEAEHLCMSMRGIKKPGSRTTTSVLRGLFAKDQAARAEVLSLIIRN